MPSECRRLWKSGQPSKIWHLVNLEKERRRAAVSKRKREKRKRKPGPGRCPGHRTRLRRGSGPGPGPRTPHPRVPQGRPRCVRLQPRALGDKPKARAPVGNHRRVLPLKNSQRTHGISQLTCRGPESGSNRCLETALTSGGDVTTPPAPARPCPGTDISVAPGWQPLWPDRTSPDCG